jgi:hypothetical protein
VIPLSSVPIDVRKEYALQLVRMDILEAWEALAVTIAPGDTLIPDPEEAPRAFITKQPRERDCVLCGRVCYSKLDEPRCWDCYVRVRRGVNGYCARGHVWSPDNVYTRPNGYQYCRECSVEESRARRAAQKAAA